MVKKKPQVGLTFVFRFSSVMPPYINYRIKQLSDVEYQIARMTTDGLNAEEISKRVSKEMKKDISAHMVRGYYRQKIYEKLGIPSSILMLCVAMDGPVPAGCFFKGLTPRQNDIARLFFVGMNEKEMARALNLEERTIKKHKEKMREALRNGGNTEDLSDAAKLLKALRSVMIHDRVLTVLLDGVWNYQEMLENEPVRPKLG